MCEEPLLCTYLRITRIWFLGWINCLNLYQQKRIMFGLEPLTFRLRSREKPMSNYSLRCPNYSLQLGWRGSNAWRLSHRLLRSCQRDAPQNFRCRLRRRRRRRGRSWDPDQCCRRGEFDWHTSCLWLLFRHRPKIDCFHSWTIIR